jgi:hypothetical protein
MPFSSVAVRREYQRVYYGRRDTLIRKAKDVPCSDCGVRYPHWIMEFDHVSGVKIRNVSRMRSWPVKSILDEIAKCDVVCSNCHANRTWQRLRSSEE